MVPSILTHHNGLKLIKKSQKLDFSSILNFWIFLADLEQCDQLTAIRQIRGLATVDHFLSPNPAYQTRFRSNPAKDESRIFPPSIVFLT